MARESFDSYVKKKSDKINKIWKQFESPKKTPTQIIPKNDKVAHMIENQKEKVMIGEK